MKSITPFFVIFLFVSSLHVFAQTYLDQQLLIRGIEELAEYEDSTENIIYNSETNFIELKSGYKHGFYISKPVLFAQKFNRGLPSWNGHAPEDQKSSFRVLMRFKMSYGWSDWVTVGFWDKYIWTYYGKTKFDGGKVSIDYVKLNEYIDEFQFKVEFKRTNVDFEPPSIKQFSFFMSDSRTTAHIDINKLVNDKPPAIFISTDFVYQYGIDPNIGGRICSPATLSMIIKSFGYEVDTYEFAVRTNDPYWDIFGVWPRGVQSTSEYGLRGSVTRYRSWTDAYNVLKNGGRIAISVGPPLFNAHLMMLAGFDDNGNPIFHNPGNSNGYGITYNKKQISESWFNKGGISYIIYDDKAVYNEEITIDDDIKVYPNPFVDNLSVNYDFENIQKVKVRIYNTFGQLVYHCIFNNPVKEIFISLDNNLPSGTYILNIHSNTKNISKIIVKK